MGVRCAEAPVGPAGSASAASHAPPSCLAAADAMSSPPHWSTQPRAFSSCCRQVAVHASSAPSRSSAPLAGAPLGAASGGDEEKEGEAPGASVADAVCVGVAVGEPVDVGGTLSVSAGTELELAVDVQGPEWMAVDRVDLFRQIEKHL